MKVVIWFVLFLFVLGIPFPPAKAQASLDSFNIEDETLPIAHSRFDELEDLPTQSFSSPSKNDMWEKFERGDLDGKAYADLQKNYKNKTAQSKIIKKRDIASISDKKTKIIKNQMRAPQSIKKSVSERKGFSKKLPEKRK